MCKDVSVHGIDLAVKWPMGSRSLKHSLKSVQGISSGEDQEDIILTSKDQGVLVLNALTQEEKGRYAPEDSLEAQLVTPAVWDTRTQRFYATTKSVSPGPDSSISYLLLSWPAHAALPDFQTPDQDHVQGMDEGPVVGVLLASNVTRTPLPRAVHSLWPVGSAGGSGAPAKDADGPSTSGRGASNGADGAFWGTNPGVVVVHSDGTVALNTQYMNGKTRSVKANEGRVIAASGCHGLVAVVTLDSQRRHKAAIYAVSGPVLKQLASIDISLPDQDASLLSVASRPPASRFYGPAT
eukprot:jgi/Botrbrau1/8096/Bobra.0230s0021.1